LIAKGHEDVDTIERNSFQREKMSAHPAWPYPYSWTIILYNSSVREEWIIISTKS
jgi:hypothetical protein